MDASGKPGVWAVIVALGLVPAAAAAAGTSPNVRLLNSTQKAVVARLLRSAARQLEYPGCQGLLDEFTDTSGRPLRVALEASGQRASEFLETSVFFYDAPSRLCGTSNLAVTAPGSRAVFVCGERFVRQASRNSRHAEAALIHEALHTLGLGENPPSSDFISERVLARCGER